MNNLESRIAKLEAGQGATAGQAAFQMTNEQLERVVLAYLVAATPDEIEAELDAHPELRELYEELMPQARKQREAVEALIERTPLRARRQVDREPDIREERHRPESE